MGSDAFHSDAKAESIEHCRLPTSPKPAYRRLASLTSNVLVLLILFADQLSAQTPSCVFEVEDQIKTNAVDTGDPICGAMAAPWEIKLHARIGQVGFLTDGTALGILHMPQRDAVPVEDWPLPIALMPLSNHTWSVNDILDGKVLPNNDPMRYFLWTPGNSKNGWRPNGVDWGDAEARMFRCINHENLEKCITYYPIPNCLGNDDPYGEMVLSVRRESATEVPDMLDEYGTTDKIAHAIVEATWASLCGGP